MHVRTYSTFAQSALVAIFVWAAPVAQALAQAEGTNPGTAQTPLREAVPLEEVVVTAQRREQKILDVPMSITAITGDELARSGATQLIDIASTVPGLATAQFSPGQNRVELRGISSLNGLPTVGSYLDEMSINVEGGFPTFGADVRFIDLERIEVLRGPQATLYGEGSMGGTIRYLTRNPDLKNASFGVDTALGSTTDGSNLYRGDVVINMPLVGDTFGMRFAGGYEKSPGWIDYTAIGVKDANSATSKTARLKTLWKVSDAFSANLLLLFQDTATDSQSFANNRTAPFVLLTPYLDKNRLGSLVLNYDLAGATVTSISNYMNRDSNTTLDFTTLLGPLYPLFFGAPAPAKISANAVDNFKLFSQEVRVVSKGAGPFNWNAGVYYQDYWEHIFNHTIATPNPLPFDLLDSGGSDESKSSAAYAEGSYRFTRAFETTLGVRYYRDKRSNPGGPAGNAFGAPAVNIAQEATFSSTNPRLVFSYRPMEGTLLYASAAKGFRSGGYNGIGLANSGCTFPVNYDPEKLWTYEVGSNLSTAGHRVVLQSAVYYNDWKQIQELQYCPGLAALGPQVVSGGKAKGEGVDVQLTLRPINTLNITLASSYNNTYYEDNSVAHLAGDRVDFVPRWTAGLGGDYDFHWTASLRGRAHLDYQYTDPWSISLRNQLAVPTGLEHSDSYGLAGARLSVLQGLWEVSIFAQNLTNQDRKVIPTYGGYLAPVSLQPRTIGVGLRYNYN